MNRKIGVTLGIFFGLVSISNISLGYAFESTNVLAVLLPGILFFLTAIGHGTLCKLGQFIATLGLGCFTIPLNDVNSLVPVLVFSIAFIMGTKYFPKIGKLKFSYPIPYLLTAYFCNWAMQDIFVSLILYGSYTTVLYILHNDKA